MTEKVIFTYLSLRKVSIIDLRFDRSVGIRGRNKTSTRIFLDGKFFFFISNNSRNLEIINNNINIIN